MAVAQVTQSRVGVVFRYIKFRSQSGSITVPDSVSIRVLPDKLERLFLVEMLCVSPRLPVAGRTACASWSADVELYCDLIN